MNSDFEDIQFDNLPVYKPLFVRSTKHQRELIERLGSKKHRLHYREIVRRCGEIIKREIRDTGQLSIGEADKIIRELGDS